MSDPISPGTDPAPAADPVVAGAATTGTPGSAEPAPEPTARQLEEARRNPWEGVWRDILGGNVLRSIVAVLLAILIGSLIIVFTDKRVVDAMGYFAARPGDTFQAMGQVIGSAYGAIFNGAIYNPTRGFAPLFNTLKYATPLIAAGLGLAVSFRAGLFNIGGQGQILAGAFLAGIVGAQWQLPMGLHFVVALIAGIAGASIWAATVGWLKAQTGAHEVILTIMFNWIAYWGITFLLKQPPFNGPRAAGNPKAGPIAETAWLPAIGPMSIGILIVILAAVAFWWLFERSTIGFRIRAVGINPNATRTAGISVKTVTIVTMALSGAFMGIAAATQVLGEFRAGYTNVVDEGIGFSAITVALLGGNHPVGVVFAGLLFGALRAGQAGMQTVGISPDIIPVIQGIIVLFVAAPPLVRAIFRLPKPTGLRLADRLAASRGTTDNEKVKAQS